MLRRYTLGCCLRLENAAITGHFGFAGLMKILTGKSHHYRKGPGKRGHIVADTLLLMMFLGLRKLGNICCEHKMFLNKIRNTFCVPDTKSATNVARAGKRGNICVGDNVSATMCPRLPGPLTPSYTFQKAPFSKLMFSFYSSRAGVLKFLQFEEVNRRNKAAV